MELVLNIGRAEQRKRRITGIVSLNVALALLAGVYAAHIDPFSRVTAFPLAGARAQEKAAAQSPKKGTR